MVNSSGSLRHGMTEEHMKQNIGGGDGNVKDEQERNGRLKSV